MSTAKVAARGLMRGVQDGLVIWHETRREHRRGGHNIMVALFKGKVRFASGDIGTYAGVEVVDMTDKRGPFSGQMTILLEDGSISNQSFTGVMKYQDGPERVGGTGSWKLVNGTGRFARRRGGGKFSWSMDGDKYHADFDA